MSKRHTITVKEEIFIAATADEVWKYTQDFSKRCIWDRSVLHATVLEDIPKRRVKLCMRMHTSMIIEYKLYERPLKTSLHTTQVVSPVIHSAGGYWRYQPLAGGTLWIQTNTIVLKTKYLLGFFRPALRLAFRLHTLLSMKRVRKHVEAMHRRRIDS